MGEEGKEQVWVEGPPPERRDYVEPRRKARRYQLEVLDKALEENTIIFLETGCGKTLIAVLWIEALSHLIRKPSKKIAVFLVPNVALVEQQAKEMEKHTDLKIGQFWGHIGGGKSWSYEWWQEQILKYEVFVMTPQLLFNNLHHCFLKMEMIELLVFDECHHADKKHPYANIMRDFYHKKKHSRPKIFGLTASPVNGKAGKGGGPQKIDGQIHNLENMLDARLYTVKDRGELERLLPNPSQYIREYPPSYPLEHVKLLSGLLRELRSKYVNASDGFANDFQTLKTSTDMKMEKKEIHDVSKLHRKLDWCIHELGLWCTIEAAEILLNKEGSRPGEDNAVSGPKEAFLRDALSMLKAADWTDKGVTRESDGDGRIDIDKRLLSPKLLCLVDIILENREKFTKGIVFVDRRVATGAVSSFMNSVKCLSFINCLPLVGSDSMTQKSQQQAIDQFRSDEVNMLVATDIAEEGLDIQSCFMVIRYDGPPKTARSFIQSRGRARQRGSTYIILVESGNQDQYNDVMQLKEKEKLMWELTENRGDMPTVLEEPEMFEVELYEVKSTGAKVTTDYSVPLLYRYCAKLPGDEFYQPAPDFSYFHRSGGIVGEINLPVTAPFQHVVGHPCQTEKMAKRVAALEACKRLHEVGALTDHLLPASEFEEANKEDPNRPNQADPMAQMELRSSLVPEAFRGTWASASAKVSLFALAIHVVAEPKDREYAPFALFLEADLGDNTKRTVTELYLTKGRTVRIQLVSHGQVEFEIDQLRDAMRYQEKIFNITLGPKTEQDPQHLSLPTFANWDPACLYLTLPLLPSTLSPVAVDWKSVRKLLTEVVPGSPPLFQAARQDGTEHESDTSDHKSQSKTCTIFHMANGPVSLEAAINSLVETTHDRQYIRQYIVEGVIENLDSHSSFGYDHSGLGSSVSQTQKPSPYRTYVDYYEKRYKVDILHPKQLLLKAKPLMKMHNLLAERTKTGPDKESVSKREAFVELPPELCCLKVLGVSSQVVNTVSLIPSFMHRLEKLLLATELHKELGTAFPEAAKVSPKTILQALTTAKCLESLSLERLEFFGDSFLKFAVSKRLFLVHDKKYDEGLLTKMRQSVICNLSLHRRGVAHKLTMYIHDELFTPKHWSAPGRPCRVHCDASNREEIHASQLNDPSNPNQDKCSEGHRWLQKKTVADVVEAFIGAHLVDGGSEAALAFMEWVGISVHFDDDLIADASTRCAGDIRFVQGKDLSELENILGYSFQNKSILVEALTHPSFQVPFGNYQRLEFLGDAVLDYLITVYLYEAYPDIPPGLLTDLRSLTASNECFADVAVRKHMQKFLLYENTHLAEQIKEFVQLKPRKEHFHGWESDKSPKVLGDLLESLAGAVLVDTAFDTDKVWSVFEPLLQPIVTPEKLHLHPVKELVELCSKRKFKCEYFASLKGIQRLGRYTVTTGEETIEAQAEKRDKRSAQRHAAYEMLGELKKRGWQHPYRDLTAALISQGRMEPHDQVNKVCDPSEKVDELKSAGRKLRSSLEDSEENRLVSSVQEWLSFTAGKENRQVAEIYADSMLLKNTRNIVSPGHWDVSEHSKTEHFSESMELDSQEILRENSQDILQQTLQEIFLETSSEADQQDDAEMRSVSSSVAELELLEMGSSASSGSLESLTTSSTPKSVGAEQEGVLPLEVHKLDMSYGGALPDLRDLTDSLHLDVAGVEESHVDESYQILNQHEAPSCKPCTYEFVTDEVIPPEVALEKQQDPFTSYTPLDTSHFQPAVCEGGSVESPDLSSEVQLLVDALVRHPVLQNGNSYIGPGVAPTKGNSKEDAFKAFFNLGHTIPSSSREKNFPGWSVHGNSVVAENAGKPREDLHNLCAKYRWTTPNYESCDGYPQGPSHLPRFAFFVSISCWLMKAGSTYDYDVSDIECEGDPMNNKSRAMDSAASYALAWLQENFEAGRTPVPAKYFR
ncbi:unnamed protein product [Calypogeia fissa]